MFFILLGEKLSLILLCFKFTSSFPQETHLNNLLWLVSCWNDIAIVPHMNLSEYFIVIGSRRPISTQLSRSSFTYKKKCLFFITTMRFLDFFRDFFSKTQLSSWTWQLHIQNGLKKSLKKKQLEISLPATKQKFIKSPPPFL